MNENFVSQISKIINDLDESQLKVEKHAFDVINSSDTSLNLVKEGIENVEAVVDRINELNDLLEKSAENIKKLEQLSKLIEDFASVITKIAGKTNMLSLNNCGFPKDINTVFAARATKGISDTYPCHESAPTPIIKAVKAMAMGIWNFEPSS